MPKRNDRALTFKEVRAIKKEGFTALGGAVGLYLYINNNGRRYYVYRYKSIDGKRSMISLGPDSEIDLATARQKAIEWKQKIREGINPAELRKRERAEEKFRLRQKAIEYQKSLNTFFYVAEAWIRERSVSGFWKNNATGESKAQSYLDLHIYPSIKDIPIAELSARDVFEMIKPIYQVKATTADKCLGLVSSVWKWAKARDLTAGENPADRKGSLGVMLEPYKNDRKAKVNYPALDFHDIPDFFVALKNKNTISAKMTTFSILTALRSKMVRYAKWGDINWKEKTLTVHEASIKTKGRGDFTVFLSDEAIDLLKSLPKVNEWIFPAPISKKPMSDAAMGKVIRDMHAESIHNGGKGWIDPTQSKERGETVIASIHGTARASFKTWARTGANRQLLDDEAVELCLAHKLKDSYEGAYNRAQLEPERRQVMQAWADYCYSNIK